MGDAFIVRQGGSIKDAYAAIKTTYPSGSVCICSNGTKTLKAKDTSGEWIFLLPSGGSWTVSCTDGTKTASRTVSIESQHQVENAVLAYELYLYDKGNVFSDITGGWHGTKAGTYYNLGTFTLGPEYIQISRTGRQAVTAETVNKIDLTLYSILKLKVTQRQTNMRLCVSGDTPMGYNTESFTELSSTGEYSLDVSALSGEYYVGIATWGEGTAGANRFDRVVLE